MPVDNNGIGYSDWTDEKQFIFRELIKTNLQMWKGNFRKSYYTKNTFQYFDITAGNGFHREYNLGSPLIFLEEISKDFNYYWTANFFELNSKNYEELNTNIGYSCIINDIDRNRVNTFLGNHRDLLLSWINKEKNYTPGLLYCDPTGNVPPFALLSKFSKIWLKIDLLVAFSATNIKRRRCSVGGESLETAIKTISKDNILIRKPFGKHQWTFFYLTNGPVPVWKSKGFYSINSPEGKEIFRKINYTNGELQYGNQPTLPNIFRIPETSQVPSD